MHKTVLFTALSLLSALTPALAAKVVVTQLKTVIVDGDQAAPTPTPTPAPTPTPSAVALLNIATDQPPVVAHAVGGKAVAGGPEAAKLTSTTPSATPSATPSTKSSAAASSAAASKPVSTGGSSLPLPTSSGGTATPGGAGYGIGAYKWNGKYGKATIKNMCKQDVYYWIDTNQKLSAPIKIQAGKNSEPYQIAPPTKEGGAAFKIADKTAGQGYPADHLHFEITVALATLELFYDISFVNCAVNASSNTRDASQCIGWKDGIAINTPAYVGQTKCHQPLCAPGTFCPEEAYYVDYYKNYDYFKKIDEPSFSCGAGSIGMDIEMIMCSGNSGSPLKSLLSKRSIAGRIEYD